MAFARTKIRPPRPRPGTLIERPALERRLGDALLSCRLVLICAAAGFGKTSALAQQIERLPAGTALAWVSCDEGDTPAQLFECLVAALEPYDPPWLTEPGALLRAVVDADTPAQRRKMAIEVINALDACDVPHGVIVVDDLHRITHPQTYEFIDVMLERLSGRWTLAIATRDEPPLALARLRAREEIAEFRMPDLRFEAAEAQALGAALGFAGDTVDRLQQRAQGWPVGLRLALNALRGAPAAVPSIAHASTVIDRHVFDFLAAEVIDRLGPELRDFLLLSSVLPALTATRCAALTGDAQAALRLEAIERAGLFTTRLDAAEPTWRLHDLFREALEARLERERPQQLPALLRRAAAGEGDMARRVGWLQRAQAWTEAADALADAAEDMVSGGQVAVLHELLDRFPPAQKDGSPRLQLVRALLAWTQWDWDSAIDATARAAGAFAARGDDGAERSARSYHCVALAGANRPDAAAAIDALLADRALDGMALARTLLASCWVHMRGDQRLVAPAWTRMLDALEATDSLPRWYECSPVPPLVGLPGMRAPLQRYIAGALRRLPEHPTPLRGMCQLAQAWLQLWAGDITAAEACAEAAASDARWLARPLNVDSYARALQAVLLALRGRAAESAATTDALIAELEGGGKPLRVRVYLGLYIFIALRCAAIVDDQPAVARLAARLAANDAQGQDWLSGTQRAGAGAYLAWAQGDLGEACARWRQILDLEFRSDLHGQVVEARLRLADALRRRGRPSGEAATVLLPLFERFDSGGEWGAVLMAGPAQLQRLAMHDWSGVLNTAQQARLQHWADAARAMAAGAGGRAAPAAPGAGAVATTPAGGAGPLTGREREVLERIAAGDSNKVIARVLDLSPHTVKRHVANILDKLALSSRGQAAAWYREGR